jgi:hypothetical protein
MTDDAGFYREHGYVHLRGVFGGRELDDLRVSGRTSSSRRCCATAARSTSTGARA